MHLLPTLQRKLKYNPSCRDSSKLWCCGSAHAWLFLLVKIGLLEHGYMAVSSGIHPYCVYELWPSTDWPGDGCAPKLVYACTPCAYICICN